MPDSYFKSFLKSFLVVYVLSFLMLSFALSTPSASAACSGLQLGSFNKYVSYIVAQRQGFFAQEGINVCFSQVVNSTQQFDTLLNGGYDIVGTSLDNVTNRVVNSGLPLSLIAAAEQGADLAFAVNTANGINSFADLKGKPIAVDAPNSGLVFAMHKILAANGLTFNTGSPDDYTLQVVGGVALRFQYLQAGQTPTGQKVYGAIFNSPTTSRLTPPVKILAYFKDYVAPFQSGAYVTRHNYANTNAANLEAFLRASIRADRFAKDPANRAIVVSQIAAELAVTSAVAEKILDAALDPVSGENDDLKMSKKGLIANIELRQEFNGFTTPLSSKDIKKLVKPGANKLYDDRFWKAAVKAVNHGADDDADDQDDD